MGRPKPLLRLGSLTFLERVVAAAQGAGLDPLRIVVGGQREAIAATLPELVPHFVVNDRVADGQLHSLRLALRGLPPSCEACVMMLVDHPLVRPATVHALVDAFAESRAEMVVPLHEGRRGHPVLFARGLFGPLCEGSLEGGARRVVREHGVRQLEVPLDDPGVLVDVDTPGEYEEIKSEERG